MTERTRRRSVRRPLPEIPEDAEEWPVRSHAPPHRRPVRGTESFGPVSDGLTKEIEQSAAASENCRRLMKIPGVGALSATMLEAMIGDADAFKNGRELSAWLGLTPRQHSTGGKSVLPGISKRGDVYLRCLLVYGARAAMRYVARKTTGPASGSKGACGGVTRTWRRWLWRTRWRGRPGRC